MEDQQTAPQRALLHVYKWLLVSPLEKLYFGGPQLYGYGFWGGRESADICAELTSAPASFWHKESDQCNQLLGKQFRAFMVALETLLWLYLLWCVVSYAARLLLWKLKIAPESWRRTPPIVLDQVAALNFRSARSRSPQPRRRAKNLD